MLQEFSVRNFLSFRDKVTLSFEATKDKTFEDWHVVEVVPGVRLLRFAMIYGANASGKTNVLKAINYLCKFWFVRKDDVDKPTNVIPFLLDKETPEQPSEFEMKFYVGDKRFKYLLSLDRKKVLEERLLYYKSERPTELFSRKWEQGQSTICINQAAVKVGKSVIGEITLRCLPNMSFFAARNQVNCVLPIIDDVRDWMRTKFQPVDGPMLSMFKYAERKMFKDDMLKQHVLGFIQKADFNITGIDTKEERVPLPEPLRKAIQSDDDMPKSDKDRLLEDHFYKQLKTSFVHTVTNNRGEEKYALSQNLQSEGTCRVIGIEAVMYSVLSEERFLCVDEIETSLHPELVEYVIEDFLKAGGRSQLLVTTHYIPLLATINDLIRKDSVWFTDKGQDGYTDLYSLVEFKGLNRISSILDAYRRGVFGAVPNIKN